MRLFLPLFVLLVVVAPHHLRLQTGELKSDAFVHRKFIDLRKRR